MLSPHERKLKQVQKVPQFNQSQKKLQKKKSKKDKSFNKSYANMNSNKKFNKNNLKESEFQNNDLTKEMNEICESDRIKCQDEVQKTLSDRFEQQFLDSLQEPIQAQDIIYTKDNALDKLFSSFKSVRVQHDLNYDSLFFNSTKDKNYDSVKQIDIDQNYKERFLDDTTNDKSHSFVKNKTVQNEYEEIQQNEIDINENNLSEDDQQQKQFYQQSDSKKDEQKEVDFLHDQKLDELIQQQSEKFDNGFDTQTKFSKMFDKYRKQSQDSEDQNTKQNQQSQKSLEQQQEQNQEDDFLRIEKELNITPNDSIEHEQNNLKKEKYDSSKFIPAQIEHIQQQQEEFSPKLPSFPTGNKIKNFQENFNFQENDENQDILQEINRIYKNSQTQSNVDSIKSQYKSNGTFNFSQQDFLEKQQDLSKIIEEGDEKQMEEQDTFEENNEEQNDKAEVFTLGGPNMFKESHREVAYTVEQLPENLQNSNHKNAYYSDAVQFQTKPQNNEKNFKSTPEQNDIELDEEQIRSQKFDELIEMMLRSKVKRIIQCWRNYKSPLNQKKYVGRFFDLYWNTYYDEDLVESFNEVIKDKE